MSAAAIRLLALAARSRDRDLAQRLRLVVLWLLWAQALAGAGREPARLRLGPGRMRGARPRSRHWARGSLSGRRPRG